MIKKDINQILEDLHTILNNLIDKTQSLHLYYSSFRDFNNNKYKDAKAERDFSEINTTERVHRSIIDLVQMCSSNDLPSAPPLYSK
jgi:hypothetical protein